MAAAALVQLTALIEDIGNRHGVALIPLRALVFGHLAKDVQDEVLMPKPKPAEFGLEGLLLSKLLQQPAITFTWTVIRPPAGARPKPILAPDVLLHCDGRDGLTSFEGPPGLAH